MTFEVEVGGRPFTVTVERTDRPGRFRIALDGRPRLIDVSRTGDFGLSLLDMGTVPPGTGTVPLSPRSADVQIAPGGGPGDLLACLHDRTIGVTVNGRRSAHAEGPLHGHGQVTIVAPMPGRVVRVLVAAGDPVDVCGPDGTVIARGLVTYASGELPRILGRSTRDLARELGKAYEREVVHRDDLVVL